ncbi:MAG: N-acetyl-gamma-glutamyl-phosphate reductase [Clostridia bacterium]|nr:N-acetyl-gamma-glutamyl-phosphate reductase [Clostridia bacterium]
MLNVFIDGSAGTTGLRIHERLSKRDDVRIISLSEDLRKNEAARGEAMDASDVTFLCLPDDVARKAVTLVKNPHTVVIDASTAHRTAEGWAYGFAELSKAHREAIARSKRIANPGCHASGFLALVYPLVEKGIASPDYPFVCHSLTGYSGGGKKMIAEYEEGERSALLDSPRTYALTQNHKHLAEMTKIARLSRAPIFVPIVADFDCGMCVSVPLYGDKLVKNIGPNGIFELFTEYYASHNTIQVTRKSEDGFLATNALKGKDGMEIFIGGNDERILLSARFDNLGKGASGAAIQNMNIASSLDETLSLVL